jgi:hypothetical protein
LAEEGVRTSLTDVIAALLDFRLELRRIERPAELRIEERG